MKKITKICDHCELKTIINKNIKNEDIKTYIICIQQEFKNETIISKTIELCDPCYHELTKNLEKYLSQNKYPSQNFGFGGWCSIINQTCQERSGCNGCAAYEDYFSKR